METADFAPGTTVRLVARPEVVGIVSGSRHVGGVLRFDVFHDNGVHGYFASQIEPVTIASKPDTISAAGLRTGLTSELLRDKNTGYLHARNVGRIDYEPYQYRPVLKIVQADRPRILVADDVGVGKTIEACLILKELQARQRARTVLVICPKPLVVDEKWRNELKRFDEDFVHLDSSDLRFCLEETLREGEWPSRFAKAILPYSLLDERLLVGGSGSARRIGLVDLAPGPHFDLVIVDEAHHIRNRSTFAYQNVQRLTESADAVVMLSATPLQTDSQDLFTLVNMLRDDLVPTERDFAQMLEPNHYLYEAVEAARAGHDKWQADVNRALDGALATAWGRQVMAVDPRVGLVRDLLGTEPEDARARIRIVRTLEDLNTFSAIVSRTRRRDIGKFTTRKPRAPLVRFTPAQEGVYNAVLALGRRIVELQAPGMPVEFLLSMLRRQAASSISALAPLAEQMLENRLDKIEFSEMGDDAPDSETVPPIMAELRNEIGKVGRLAAELDGLPDPKVDVLQQVVTDKQAEDNNKVLVFSTFRHTLRYLEEQARGWDVRVAVVHGAVPDEDRHSFRRRFKLPKSNPDAIDLMLCSEVGTEGLDYQFCNTLVNYDIPWNPMRIEQRIGRIDRRGQQSESVAIINILTQGTIEAEIYERCLLRIGVFHRALGGSEKILGDLTTGLRKIAEDLTLSESEREARLRQLADNEVARIHELERLEDQQGALLGLTTESFESRIAEASTEWLEDDKISGLVRSYFETMSGRRIALQPGRIAVVRLDENTAAQIGDNLRAVGGDARLERLLRRIPVVLRLTTDAELAADEDDVELLGATHPIVLAAAQHAALAGVPTASLRVRSNLVPPGHYPVAVHSWTRFDSRDTLTLRYVSTDASVEAAADALLAMAVDGGPQTGLGPMQAEMLEQRHHVEWESARDKHVARAKAAGAQRVASLKAQRDRQLRVVEENASKVSDAKIVKMRQGELAAIQEKFDRLIARHQRAVTGADLITKQLATALLEVEAP
ncbi:helicase-related protein [Arthrobacter sp. ES3-54]|uniref:DEAD/DEAH box helicase n=1 Tax=Arthrobacter sp. ES3-54 TaxID=1502991 RepID=UPI002404F030|nr:helicase-related protein [Arthrobacter sp. ES3-54]MDF9751559.1 ATP-dependent helicase HepA [Arthrobacter sp. ES3-54]